MQVTRLGHATVLMESPYVRIMIDPGNLTDDWHGVADLDAVLVTHQHADHLDTARMAELMGMNPSARLVVEAAVVEMLEEVGVTAHEVAPGDVLEVGPMKVEAVGGTHAVIHERIPRVGNVGFLLSEADGARIFHPGDSYDYAPQGVDILALPVAAPWAKVGETSDFLAQVAPHEAFPIHDAGLNDAGRSAYLRILGGLKDEAITVHAVAPDASLSI